MYEYLIVLMKMALHDHLYNLKRLIIIKALILQAIFTAKVAADCYAPDGNHSPIPVSLSNVGQAKKSYRLTP